MTPFLAALSKALIAWVVASLAWSSSFVAMSPSTLVMQVLVKLRTDLFRIRFLLATLAALGIDLGNSSPPCLL